MFWGTEHNSKEEGAAVAVVAAVVIVEGVEVVVVPYPFCDIMSVGSVLVCVLSLSTVLVGYCC